MLGGIDDSIHEDQDNREIVVPVNQNVGTTATKVTYFTRMNPPEFHCSMVEEDPREFINEVYKFLMIMGVTSMKKVELVAYQLKDVAHVWFNQWKEERVVDTDHVNWEKFKVAFLYRFFPVEIMEEKIPTKFSSQGFSNAPVPKINKDRVSNPKPQGGNGGGSSLSTYTRCGMKHNGKYLASVDDSFGCGKSGHKIKDCTSLTSKGRESRQATPNGSSSSAPKQNWFYALQNSHEQEGFPHVVTGMLNVFHPDVYAFVDPAATLSFVMPFVAMRSEDEHSDHLRIVLQVLKDQQLFTKFSKCEFLLRSMPFLGHIICDKGIEVDPKKTNVVKSWPRPLSHSEVCEKSFQELKDRVTSTPVLTLPEGSDGFITYWDTSRIGLSKANVVVDALGRLSIHSVTHVEYDKNELVHDVHRLA
ncbi:hypothetical protein MTR67_026330 [Solanum verrucosum]|uniref:Gag-pol polyprotein n=1 Tax=Solanum verrucosum TaxID=315347 RepID=A0AAF0R229_SOLVR|nr:hypothetical protein MTR67_026330 [Solanum verrucosum]